MKNVDQNVRTVTQLAGGLGWPEGPTQLHGGMIAFVETYRSRVSVYDSATGVTSLHEVGGGPNACLSGSDGSIYVTQNGGVIGPWRAEIRRPPSIQKIAPDGKVEVLLDRIGNHVLRAPNDLAFGPDGWLYFTDPGGPYDPSGRKEPGFICAIRPDGTGVVLEELEPTYPNGIAIEDDGSVVWVESYTGEILRRRSGSIERICILSPPVVPDGFKIDSEGNFFVTGVDSGTVEVVSKDGILLSSLKIGSAPTNCLFVGSSLFVTDGGKPGLSTDPLLNGALWKVDLLHTQGQTTFVGTIS